MKATSETAAAGSAYLIRLRTTPRMSAPCVPAEAIVVSEIGDTLSPNVAPAMIAPSRKAGLAPTAEPAG